VSASVWVEVRHKQQKEIPEMTNIDRSAVAQALAKAIAFKCCGKDMEAKVWARRLIELLQLADILR
jgi:hypothetical protein